MVTEGDLGAGVASLLAEAEGRRRAGRLTEARMRFADAARAAEESGDDPGLVLAALGMGGIWVSEQRDVVGRAAVDSLWRRARALAAPGSVEEARLAVRQTTEAVYEGGTLDAAVAAVERVRALGSDAAAAEALSLLHHAQLGPRYAEARLGLAEEIVALGARAGDGLLTLMGLCWRTVDLFLLGDPRAGQSLQELRECSAAQDCEAVAFVADVLRAMVLARAGHLDEAEAAATSALERGTAAGDPDAPAYYGAMLAALRWWQGRELEIIDLVRTISTSPRLGPNDHVYVAADALLSATIGDRDSTEEALARVAAIGLESPPHSSSWSTTQFLVAETAYLVGDASLASTVGELLAPYAHLPVMPSLAVVCLGSGERALGLCAATVGRLDAAVHHLDAAIRADRLLGSRPMSVLTEHVLASVLQARGSQGDEAHADQLTRRARDRARRMGMVLPDPPSWLVASKPAARTRSREASMQSCSGGWRIVVEGRATLLPDRVGYGYLAELLTRPGQDLDALDLASGCSLRRGGADAISDDAAIRCYRSRIEELKTMIGGESLDPGVARGYRQELAMLTTAVGSSVGLGGRARTFPENGERARTAVRKALMRVVGAIEAVEPELGHHLRASLVTGITCRYTPATDWNVTVQRNPP